MKFISRYTVFTTITVYIYVNENDMVQNIHFISVYMIYMICSPSLVFCYSTAYLKVELNHMFFFICIISTNFLTHIYGEAMVPMKNMRYIVVELTDSEQFLDTRSTIKYICCKWTIIDNPGHFQIEWNCRLIRTI